jgi:hypothetical protein
MPTAAQAGRYGALAGAQIHLNTLKRSWAVVEARLFLPLFSNERRQLGSQVGDLTFDGNHPTG